MTKAEEHKEWIKSYLEDNNLTPFKMYTSKEGVLNLTEVSITRVQDRPLDYLVLIDQSTIEKQSSGYLRFVYQNVFFEYFEYRENRSIPEWNRILTQEHIDKYHVRENNIETVLVYDKNWKALFFKKYEKTKAIKYISGYVYTKDSKGNKPFKTDFKSEKFVSHYNLTLTV